jgi:hypothetical protein
MTVSCFDEGVTWVRAFVILIFIAIPLGILTPDIEFQLVVINLPLFFRTRRSGVSCTTSLLPEWDVVSRLFPLPPLSQEMKSFSP